MTVTSVSAPTTSVLAAITTLVLPAGIVAVGGTTNAGSSESRKTFIPELGAAADIEIVTDAASPPGTFPGVMLMSERTPGSTVSVPETEIAFPVAVIVATVDVATPKVGKLTVIRSWPAGISTDASGLTAADDDFNAMANPPVGAGPDKRMTPDAIPPPRRLSGSMLKLTGLTGRISVRLSSVLPAISSDQNTIVCRLPSRTNGVT